VRLARRAARARRGAPAVPAPVPRNHHNRRAGVGAGGEPQPAWPDAAPSGRAAPHARHPCAVLAGHAPRRAREVHAKDARGPRAEPRGPRRCGARPEKRQGSRRTAPARRASALVARTRPSAPAAAPMIRSGRGSAGEACCACRAVGQPRGVACRERRGAARAPGLVIVEGRWNEHHARPQPARAAVLGPSARRCAQRRALARRAAEGMCLHRPPLSPP